MAGGKLTPRQKMINLMYLVFIAMLALNMSKEVLSAFGLMNEKFESSNTAALATNDAMLQALDKKASEDTHFSAVASDAHKVHDLTKKFYDYIGKLKLDATNGVEVDKETGKLPYEAMDKGAFIDEHWFQGDGYSSKGKEIFSTIEKYKADMKTVIAGNSKLSGVMSELNSKFDTQDVKDHEGVSKKYLSYHFEHFPSIASLAKMTSWQNDIKKAESDIYSILLGKAAVESMSLKTFQAIVALDKNVYFQGETVTGKVVLGKYDANTKPVSFQGPGKIVNGQAVISMTAGAVGEQSINGKFSFIQEGETVALPFSGKYVVVPRPNSATIAADKMNVVYRGVVNPMTISFAGVADNNVTASGAGLSKTGKTGKYNMFPGSGSEVIINVSAKLPDGKMVSDKKAYRIKNIPAPQGAIGGQVGVVQGARSRLEVSQITAVLQDFDFALDLRVVQFSLKVAGQPTVVVSGDRVNAQCKTALLKATRGDQVTISDIKTKLEGSDLILKQTAPVIYEIK